MTAYRSRWTADNDLCRCGHLEYLHTGRWRRGEPWTLNESPDIPDGCTAAPAGKQCPCARFAARLTARSISRNEPRS